MDRDVAELVKGRATSAVRLLDSIVADARGRCSADQYETIKHGVGHAIGSIQMEVLEVIIAEYPDLDDLKDI